MVHVERVRHLVERLASRVHAPKTNGQHELQPVCISLTHIGWLRRAKQSPILHPFWLTCKLPLSRPWIPGQISLPRPHFWPKMRGTSSPRLTFSYKLMSIFTRNSDN